MLEGPLRLLRGIPLSASPLFLGRDRNHWKYITRKYSVYTGVYRCFTVISLPRGEKSTRRDHKFHVHGSLRCVVGRVSIIVPSSTHDGYRIRPRSILGFASRRVENFVSSTFWEIPHARENKNLSISFSLSLFLSLLDEPRSRFYFILCSFRKRHAFPPLFFLT